MEDVNTGQETDLEKRKKIVWEIDRKLLEDGARPVIMWIASSRLSRPFSRTK